MIKDKLTSAANHVKDHSWEYGAAAFVAGIIGLEMKYPGTFYVAEEPKPDVIVKIVHVHE